MTRWTEADSDALDQRIREGRKAEKRERAGMPAPVTITEAKRAVAAGTRYIADLPTVGPMGGRPRHKAMPKPTAPKPPKPHQERRPTKPRQKPNGRWLAVINRDGVRRERTVDTEAEAWAWLDTMKEDESWHDAK